MWRGCPATSILPPTMCACIRSRTMLSFGFVINLVPSSGNNLVPTSGHQIWYPLLGTKSGTHFWSPLCSKLYSILSAKLGTHFLAPNLVPTSGRQIWYPLLGTKSGTHFWCHVECFFLVQTLSIPGLAFVSATPACPPHFHPPRSHPPPLCYRAWCHDWLGSNRTNHGTLSLLKASLAGHMVRVLARLSALARNLFGKKCSSIKYQFASYNPTVGEHFDSAILPFIFSTYFWAP